MHIYMYIYRESEMHMVMLRFPLKIWVCLPNVSFNGENKAPNHERQTQVRFKANSRNLEL